jgi:hypothetical protein
VGRPIIPGLVVSVVCEPEEVSSSTMARSRVAVVAVALQTRTAATGISDTVKS